MLRAVSTEIEVNAPASQAWELYGTGLKLAEFVELKLSTLIQKIEVVEGHGDVGTVLKLIFAKDVPGFSSYKEKYTKVDNENKIKEAEVVEGGYLGLGFTLYRVRFEVIEKSEVTCITKATIEYELKEESAANASIVSIQPLRMILEAAAKQLHDNYK